MERKFVYNDITLKPDEDNNIVLLSKKSIAPLEVFQYGINSEGKYYLRWDYPLLGDYELETDYREITQERILEDLNNCEYSNYSGYYLDHMDLILKN